jgi:hypothetical protein
MGVMFHLSMSNRARVPSHIHISKLGSFDSRLAKPVYGLFRSKGSLLCQC